MKNRINETVGPKQIPVIIVASLLTIGIILYSFQSLRSKSLYPGGDPWLVWVMITVCCVIAFLWVYVLVIMPRNIPLERIYLACGLLFGVIFLFLIPPYGTPDEPAHFNAAYHVSNVLLGTRCEGEGLGLFLSGTSGSTINMRLCDQNVGFSTDFDRSTYNYMLENLFAKTGDTTMAPIGSGAITPGILYFISGIGIALARLLHMNTVSLMLFASGLNMVFFVLSVFYSIKRTPFAKMAFLAVALMPTMLQQASSLSYDNVILASAIVLTSQALAFAFEPETLGRRDYVIYGIAAFVMVFAKGGAYILLVFLPVLLGLRRDMLTKKRVLLFAGFCVLVGLFLMRNSIYDFLFAQPAAEAAGAVESGDYGAYVGWAGSYAYSLTYYLHSPGMLIKMLVRTLWMRTSDLLIEMVGNGLGWLSIWLPALIPYCFLWIAFLGTLPGGEEQYELSGRQKLALFVTVGSSAAACAMAMLLYWTPMEAEYIEGLQGRYFLPVLLSALLVLRNKLIRTDERLNKWLILFLLLLDFLVVYLVA